MSTNFIEPMAEEYHQENPINHFEGSIVMNEGKEELNNDNNEDKSNISCDYYNIIFSSLLIITNIFLLKNVIDSNKQISSLENKVDSLSNQITEIKDALLKKEIQTFGNYNNYYSKDYFTSPDFSVQQDKSRNQESFNSVGSFICCSSVQTEDIQPYWIKLYESDTSFLGSSNKKSNFSNDIYKGEVDNRIRQISRLSSLYPSSG